MFTRKTGGARKVGIFKDIDALLTNDDAYFVRMRYHFSAGPPSKSSSNQNQISSLVHLILSKRPTADRTPIDTIPNAQTLKDTALALGANMAMGHAMAGDEV
jgi:hypothetical protein